MGLHHFRQGKIILKCTANIAGIYWQTEEIAHLARELTTPFPTPPSLRRDSGNKTTLTYDVAVEKYVTPLEMLVDSWINEISQTISI